MIGLCRRLCLMSDTRIYIFHVVYLPQSRASLICSSCLRKNCLLKLQSLYSRWMPPFFSGIRPENSRASRRTNMVNVPTDESLASADGLTSERPPRCLISASILMRTVKSSNLNSVGFLVKYPCKSGISDSIF